MGAVGSDEEGVHFISCFQRFCAFEAWKCPLIFVPCLAFYPISCGNRSCLQNSGCPCNCSSVPIANLWQCRRDHSIPKRLATFVQCVRSTWSCKTAATHLRMRQFL